MGNPNATSPDGQARELDGRDGNAGTAATFVARSGIQGATAVEAAHELANLLTILLGSLEPLRRQKLDERGRQQLERAERSTRQVCDLLSPRLPSSDPFCWKPHEPG